jgi:hypothetical protein
MNISQAFSAFGASVDTLGTALGVDAETMAKFDGALSGLEGNIENQNPLVTAAEVGLAVVVTAALVEAVTPVAIGGAVASAASALAGADVVAGAAAGIDFVLESEAPAVFSLTNGTAIMATTTQALGITALVSQSTKSLPMQCQGLQIFFRPQITSH